MKSLQILEDKLNIATDLIDKLDIEDYDIIPSVPMEITTKSSSGEEVFSIDALKSDFMLIRQNVIKLVATGQRILDSASIIDISDMKASQLSALSSLQETLGNNLKLLVNIYREICEIERMRLGMTGKPSTIPSAQQINSGNTINNIVFSGDTSSLLDIIKQHSN